MRRSVWPAQADTAGSLGAEKPLVVRMRLGTVARRNDGYRVLKQRPSNLERTLKQSSGEVRKEQVGSFDLVVVDSKGSVVTGE